VPLLNDQSRLKSVGAEGVHLGQDDTDVMAARAQLGPLPFIGLTVKTVAQAWSAPLRVIDYVGIGGVFSTASKDNPDPPIGLTGLREMVRVFRYRIGNFPMCAIAGINADNAADVIAAGVDGVSVVSRSRAPSRAAARRCAQRSMGACTLRGVPAVGAAGLSAMTAIALTIAGCDSRRRRHPADLRHFCARRLRGERHHPLTAQNTKGVAGIHDVPPEFVTDRSTPCSRTSIDAVKIGMLAHADHRRCGARSIATPRATSSIRS
jgi:thiamine-phosphate diphosphorylase